MRVHNNLTGIEISYYKYIQAFCKIVRNKNRKKCKLTCELNQIGLKGQTQMFFRLFYFIDTLFEIIFSTLRS